MSESIDIQEYLDQMANINQLTLAYLNEECTDDVPFNELIQYIKDQKIHENIDEFKAFLHFIINVSNYYLHSHDFYTKIEKILNEYKHQIIQYFSNIEIFNIFESSKRLLLYLFNQKILIPDDTLKSIIQRGKYSMKKYPFYFSPEFKLRRIDDLIDFNNRRNEGENEAIFCRYIRNDSIEDFISYSTQSNLSLNTNINKSIFETNLFLLEEECTSLIEYAAFFGSIQVFNYLKYNNVELTKSIWPYAIHGQNAEIIHILEKSAGSCSLIENLKNSIKFFNEPMINYVRDVCFKDDMEQYVNVTSQTLKYYNFTAFPEVKYFYRDFTKFVQYGYTTIIKYLYLSKKETDYNRKTILY